MGTDTVSRFLVIINLSVVHLILSSHLTVDYRPPACSKPIRNRDATPWKKDHIFRRLSATFSRQDSCRSNREDDGIRCCRISRRNSCGVSKGLSLHTSNRQQQQIFSKRRRSLSSPVLQQTFAMHITGIANQRRRLGLHKMRRVSYACMTPHRTFNM